MNAQFFGEEKLSLQLQNELSSRGFTTQFVSSPLADAAANSADTAIFTVSSPLAEMPDYASLRAQFEQLKARQITTAIAFADFPVRSENYLMYWAMTVPFVDFFIIPYPAAIKMFEPDQFDSAGENLDAELCAAVSLSIINLGVAAVWLSFSNGGYLRTSSIGTRLRSVGKGANIGDENWRAREIFALRKTNFVSQVSDFFSALKTGASPEKSFSANSTNPATAAPTLFANLVETSPGIFAGKYDKIEM